MQKVKDREAKLLRLLTQTESIEELLDYAEEMLELPILFLEYYSEKVYTDKTTKNNYLANKFIEELYNSKTKSSVLEIEKSENYLTKEVFYLEEKLGYIIILEEDNKILERYSELIESISDSLALIYKIKNNNPIKGWKIENEEKIFEKLLFRRFNTIDDLDLLSDYYTFRNYDLFYIGIAPISSEETEVYINQYLNELKELHIGLWNFKEKDFMVSMFGFNKNTITPNDFFKIAEKKIDQQNVLIVFGDPFSHILETERQFNNIKDILFNNSSLSWKYGIYFLDDYKFINFLSDLNPYINGANNYISYKVLDILKYDEKNNTDYAETLRVYLSQSQSPLRTSKILFVHKNTVIYRIKKIKSLFNVDFTKADQCFQLYFSFQLLFTRGWKGKEIRD